MASATLENILKPRAETRGLACPSERNEGGPKWHPHPVKSSSEKKRLGLYAALIVLDAAILSLAFATANIVRLGNPLDPIGFTMLVVTIPIFFAVTFNNGAYSLRSLENPRFGALRVTQAFVLSIAAVLAAMFYLKASAEFSRIVMAIATIGSLVLLPFARISFGHIAGSRCGWRFTNQVLLVDGDCTMAEEDDPIILAAEVGLWPTLNDPEALDRAGQLLKHYDRVVIVCPRDRRSAWSSMLKGLGISVEIRAPELDGLGTLAIGRYGKNSTLVVSQGPLRLSDRIMKRLFDLGVAALALLITAPLLLAVAIAIKIDTPGPVLFRQPRVGLGNRIFWMYKFRSMRVEAHDLHCAKHTLPGDSRVTRVGAFLRKTSLDELPQLVNVLLGDMSIAGPRPHALGTRAGGSTFWELDDCYSHRHAIKPGMTGLAQVRGLRGSTFHKSDLTNRLQADLEYLSGWSIWRDISILGRTAKVLRYNAF